MRQKWKAKCAKGVFILEWSELDGTWIAGEFPPVKEKVLLKLMGKHWDLEGKDDDEVDEILLGVLKALAVRATNKMNQSPVKILGYVVADVKRGKQPAKNLSPWEVEYMEEVAKPLPVVETKPVEQIFDGGVWLTDGGHEWGQDSMIEDAHRYRERVAGGYVELDLDGNPKGKPDKSR